MRLLRHLYEAEEEKDKAKDKEEPKDKKKEKTPEEEKAEEKQKAIERFTTMLMAAVQPSMLNMVVQQVAPFYVRWGDEWLSQLEDAIRPIVSDRLRTEFIKVVKNVSIRFHHIKNETEGQSPDDMRDKNSGGVYPESAVDATPSPMDTPEEKERKLKELEKMRQKAELKRLKRLKKEEDNAK